MPAIPAGGTFLVGVALAVGVGGDAPYVAVVGVDGVVGVDVGVAVVGLGGVEGLDGVTVPALAVAWAARCSSCRLRSGSSWISSRVRS